MTEICLKTVLKTNLFYAFLYQFNQINMFLTFFFIYRCCNIYKKHFGILWMDDGCALKFYVYFGSV